MGKRRNRIVYAPKSRLKSSASDRNQSASSNAQETEEKLERKKPKRTSRIAYDPKSRRKRSSSGEAEAQATSSNVQTINENSGRNKRRANDSASFDLQSRQQQPERKKRSVSSTKEKASIHRGPASEQTEAVSEVTDQHKTVAKKRVYKRRIQPKGADAAPERIRDMTVTKKTYAKWKPLSSSTKKYTKQVLESAILTVLNSVGKESKKDDIQVHLKQLSDRIVKRLDSIKGPIHKGDYTKMEPESHGLVNAVLSCNGQIEALEKELEEQTRLLEQDEQRLNSYNDQETELQQQEQLHPLLKTEPVNTLNLPSLSEETHKTSAICQIPASLEGNGRRLAQSLAKISDQAEQAGFTNWLEVLSARKK